MDCCNRGNAHPNFHKKETHRDMEYFISHFFVDISHLIYLLATLTTIIAIRNYLIAILQ